MATYQELKGRPIKSTASDLSGAAFEGEVWYNSTTNVLKVMYPFTGWSASDPTVVGRYQAMSCGTVTAGLYFGGGGPGGIAAATMTEEFDGTSWTTVPGVMTQRRTDAMAFGIQTAAGVVGGRINDGNPGPTYTTVKTEEYDGTSWSAGGDYPLIIVSGGSGGTQTAAFGATGYTTPGDPGTDTPVSAEYDGTSWTAGNPVITARRDVNMGPSGTQTAALMICGRAATTHQTAVEEYDGTSWATVNATPATQRAAMCFGTQTSTLAGFGHQGGQGTVVSTCVSYDGTSWAAAPSGGTARYACTGVGTSSTSGLNVGGYTMPGWGLLGLTEEFAAGGTVVKTITTS